MTSFYRGKRVSDYRKQGQFTSAVLAANGAVRLELTTGPSDRVRAIKNFRALVTIRASDSTPYNNFASGFLCMFRCAATDYPSGGPLNIEASAVLHPVPFAMGGASLTLAYEFGGITAGQTEEVWFVCQGRIGGGSNNATIASLWAQKDTVTP